ncbi:MAG: hypothetical protein AAGG11_10060, partial [Pseudomonadota bacterium]
LGPDSSTAATLGAASEAGEGAAAAISEPPVVLPLWVAGLARLVPLLSGGFVWWLLGQRRLYLPVLAEPA